MDIKRKSKTARDLARKEWQWRLFLLALVALIAWSIRGFNWHVVLASGPYLLKGLGTSWLLAIISISIGGVIAVPLAWARIYGPVSIRHAAIAIIEIVRAIPELMVVFWIYFAFPALAGFTISNWSASIAALSILAAAYLAEVFRGGIYSVSDEQWSAGLCRSSDLI